MEEDIVVSTTDDSTTDMAVDNSGMDGNILLTTSTDAYEADMESAVMTVSNVPDAFANKYNDNSDSFIVGEMSERCEHCDAKMFSGERVKGHFSLCCSNGKVVLPDESKLGAVPVYLKTLLTSNSREAVNAADLLYPKVGEHYVLAKGAWKKRVIGKNKVICRMYAVSPLDRERYFLRLLLLHVRGPKSFEDLKTVNGILFRSFHEAAKMRGLLEDNEEWSKCLTEAAAQQMPSSLRQLFSIILIFCNSVNPTADELFDRHKDDL